MYPAGERGIAVRRVQVGGGVSLRVLEAGPRTGTPVALLHGWAGSVYSFAELIPSLAGAGYRAIALDLPGHGLSDKPADGAHYTVPAMADAVAAVLRDAGASGCAIIAHSMAGAIAFELSQRDALRPRGIVFCGAVGVGHVPIAWLARFLTPKFVDRILPALISRGVAREIADLAFGSPDRPTETDVDEYWAPSQFDAWARALRLCLHHANWHREARELLRNFTVPTLVLAGRKDRVVQGVARGGRMIPPARVRELSDAGHLLMQEKASVTNDEILAFLRSLSGANGG